MFRLVNILKFTNTLKYPIANYASVLKMPNLSPTMTEGGIVKWYKKEGDSYTAGDVICDVQTDKAVIGLEADDDGIVAKIIKPDNTQNLKVGEPIAMIAEPDEDWKSVEIPDEIKHAAETVPDTPSSESVPTSTTTATATKEDDEKMGPAVRRLLDTYGLNAHQISQHTGPKNTLLKADVLKFIESSKLSPVEQKSKAPDTVSTTTTPHVSSSSSAPFIDIELTGMRQTIAKRMVASKTSAPHHYTTGKADINELLQLRKELKAKNIANISVNDFVVKACAFALRMVPQVNCSLTNDGHVQYNPTVDISVAVASDSGLITPIVFNADQLGISDISSNIRALAEKARKNRLQPQEFMGGTFTISNLGMFGIKEFTAIINAPQAAILAVGSGLPEVQVDPTTGKLVEHQEMRFTLSADVRIVGQNDAAHFLAHVTEYLEHPTMLVGSLLSDSQHSQNTKAWSY